MFAFILELALSASFKNTIGVVEVRPGYVALMTEKPDPKSNLVWRFGKGVRMFILDNARNYNGFYRAAYPMSRDEMYVGYIGTDNIIIQEKEPTIRDKARDFVYKKIGSPYVYGGTGPNTFDDAGMIRYAFKQAGKELKGTPKDWMGYSVKGMDIKWEWYEEGDVVFFGDRQKPRVGIITGRDSTSYSTYVTATTPGSVFEEKNIHKRNDVIKVKRIEED